MDFEFPKSTHCCLCNAQLNYTVEYYDEKNFLLGVSSDVSIYDIYSPLFPEAKTAVITAAYCPDHQLLFRI